MPAGDRAVTRLLFSMAIDNFLRNPTVLLKRLADGADEFQNNLLAATLGGPTAATKPESTIMTFVIVIFAIGLILAVSFPMMALFFATGFGATPSDTKQAAAPRYGAAALLVSAAALVCHSACNINLSAD